MRELLEEPTRVNLLNTADLLAASKSTPLTWALKNIQYKHFNLSVKTILFFFHFVDLKS